MTETKEKKEKKAELHIEPLKKGSLTIGLIGTEALITNSMSLATRKILLSPTGRKSEAAKRNSLKHNPYEEFLASMYMNHGKGPEEPLLALPSTAFKRALCDAALDIPAVKKAQIARLLWVRNPQVLLYGSPCMMISTVRNSDMGRTPDQRTRAAFKRWACLLTIDYVSPLLDQKSVGNLVYAAGMIIGVGDWRNQKGSGSFGQFSLVGPEETAEFEDIVKTEGRAIQEEKIKEENLDFYDEDSAQLYAHWKGDAKGRDLLPIATAA